MQIAVRSFALLFVLAAAPAYAAELEKLEVIVPERENLQYMSFLVAIGGGHFAAEGIEIALVVANTPGEAEDLVRDRRAPVAVLSPPAYLRLIAEGAPIVLAANLLQNDAIDLVVHADAGFSKEAPLLERIQALRGKKIGVAPGPRTRLAKLLELGGLDPSRDVELVVVAGDSQNELFGQRGVDALYCHTPYLERALLTQGAVVLIDQAGGEVPELAQRQIHALIVDRALRDARPELVERLVRAIAAAQASIHADEGAAIEALSRVVSRPRAELEKVVTLYRAAIPPSPAVSSDAFQQALELFPAHQTRPSLEGIALEAFVLGATPVQPVAEDDVEEVAVIGTAQRLAEAARPDTTVRLTGKEILERGVANLGQALDSIPDTPIRASGRQVMQVNVRGARKGGVLLLLDGVPISDPFYGNFDVSSIPATDIAEIRVSLTPASPLDGPSGNGGVIEVLTRSAQGAPFVRAQAQVTTAPSGLVAATGRGELAPGLAMRVSASGSLDGRGLPISLPDGTRDELDSRAHQSSGGLRIERSTKDGALSLDLSASHRRYLIPPGEYPGAGVSRIPDENIFRGVLSGQMYFGEIIASARIFSLYLDHEGVNYRNATFEEIATRETIRAQRTGGFAQLDVPFSDDLRLTAVAHVLVESGRDRVEFDGGANEASGSIPIVEPAAGVVWILTPWLTIDGAAGAAIPLGEDATPWPEAKLTTTLTLDDVLELKLVGAHKGRLPSLRDRFSPTQGNPAIGPETGTSAEGSVKLAPIGWASIELSGFWRFTDGLIRVPPGTPRGPNGTTPVDNVGDVTVRGFEARAQVSPWSWLSAGVAYEFADAQSEALGDDPLDFFPQHRGELFLNARLREKAGLWSRLRYTGTRLDNSTELQPYTTLDAAVWFRLQPVQLTLRAENILDTSYELRDGIPGYGTTISLAVEAMY